MQSKMLDGNKLSCSMGGYTKMFSLHPLLCILDNMVGAKLLLTATTSWFDTSFVNEADVVVSLGYLPKAPWPCWSLSTLRFAGISGLSSSHQEASCWSNFPPLGEQTFVTELLELVSKALEHDSERQWRHSKGTEHPWSDGKGKRGSRSSWCCCVIARRSLLMCRHREIQSEPEMCVIILTAMTHDDAGSMKCRSQMTITSVS